MAFVNVDVDACWPRVRVGLKDGKRQCFEMTRLDENSKVLLGLGQSVSQKSNTLVEFVK